jgi:hypothetical protein
MKEENDAETYLVFLLTTTKKHVLDIQRAVLWKQILFIRKIRL